MHMIVVAGVESSPLATPVKGSSGSDLSCITEFILIGPGQTTAKPFPHDLDTISMRRTTFSVSFSVHETATLSFRLIRHQIKLFQLKKYLLQNWDKGTRLKIELSLTLFIVIPNTEITIRAKSGDFNFCWNCCNQPYSRLPVIFRAPFRVFLRF